MRGLWRTGCFLAAGTGGRRRNAWRCSVLGTGREGCVERCLRVLGGVICAGRHSVCHTGGLWGDNNSGRRADRSPARPGHTAGAVDGSGYHSAAGACAASRAAAGGSLRSNDTDDGHTPGRGQSICRHGQFCARAFIGAERHFFKPAGGPDAAGTDAAGAAAGVRCDGN